MQFKKNIADKMQAKLALSGKLDCNNIVQKCKPLLLMKSVPFSLGEIKVLDVYLSRINSHVPECCSVTFTKTEYEELMGLTDCDHKTLKKYTASLLGKIIQVPMPRRGYLQFVLFTSARLINDEFGKSTIELTCSQQAKDLFFNIESLGYLKYSLKNILCLQSKHSYLLYLYLLSNRFRSIWEVSTQELKNQVFDLKNNEYYNAFKYFKRDILDKSVNEINKKTNIDVSYSVVKSGRSVVSIKFTIHKIKDDIQEQQELVGQTSFAELKELQRYQYSTEYIELLASACDYEFDENQIMILSSMLNDINIKTKNETFSGERQFMYLQNKYLQLQVSSKKQKIYSRFDYLKSLIK